MTSPTPKTHNKIAPTNPESAAMPTPYDPIALDLPLLLAVVVVLAILFWVVTQNNTNPPRHT